MRFQPKSDREIAENNLLPKGEYDYEVIEAKEARSKSGNEMIALKVRVFHGESERTMNDYLLDSMPGKLKHFCVQNGLQRQYDGGTLCADDCSGRTGRAFVGIEKDRAGNYPDKNKIVDYVVPKDEKQASQSAQQPNAEAYAAGITDDDVPF